MDSTKRSKILQPRGWTGDEEINVFLFLVLAFHFLASLLVSGENLTLVKIKVKINLD